MTALQAPLRFRGKAVAAPPSQTWLDLLAAFLAAQQSTATRSVYGRYLRGFLQHTACAFSPASLTAFRASLAADGRSPNTHAVVLTACRSFLTWSRLHEAHDLSAEQVAGLLPSPKAVVVKPYQILSNAEAAGMLATVADSPRDLAMLAVLLSAGLRAAECRMLDTSDLLTDQDGWSLHIRCGKGSKDRITPISDEVAALVRAYLAASGRQLGKAASGPLWLATGPGAAARRLSTRMLAYVVTRAAEAAGVTCKRITPHSMRHTCAVNYLRGGGNVADAALLLGHSNISTTSRYLAHLNLGAIRANLPPLPLPAAQVALTAPE